MLGARNFVLDNVETRVYPGTQRGLVIVIGRGQCWFGLDQADQKSPNKSRRAPPLRELGMVDTASGWTGVIIRTKATDSKKFIGLVTTALTKIDSKPVGHLLRQAIESEIGKLKFGYLICIQPNISVKKTFGPLIKWRKYNAGSTTFGSNMVDSKNAVGTVSAIKWDPQSVQTPDGARPPFIALAHELIHCMHNLMGTSYMTGVGDVKVDEMMVTGLQGYEQQPISENRIREEHGIRYRSSYHGLCSAAEGTPDVTAF